MPGRARRRKARDALPCPRLLVALRRRARARLPRTCRGLATTLAAGRAALARRPALRACYAPLAERPLAGLDPPAEGDAVRLRQQLLESRQHVVLFLGHVVLDVLLEGAHPGVDVLVGRLRVMLAEPGDVLLDARVLGERFGDEALHLGVGGRLRRGVEDLLLDPAVHVELAADVLDGRPPLACGDVARHAPHETGQPAAALEAAEELFDAVVVLHDELDGVPVIPPR